MVSLGLVELQHPTTKFFLFELVYSYPPPYIATYESRSAKMDVVRQSLLDKDKMLSILISNLFLAQNRMKVEVDKHKIGREFAMGDLVHLKLVPY